MQPEISVVIPSFRRPYELARAIESVQRQRGVKLEIVVVDDCPDGSAEGVVRGFGDASLRYLRNPQPSGGRPGLVRNLGWPVATGRYVHFLDDDDLVPDGHYEAAMAAFAQVADIGVVFGRVEPFGEVESQVSWERDFFGVAAQRASRLNRMRSKRVFAGHLFFNPTLLVCGAALVRRECVAAVGGFDENMGLMEDVDFYARVIRRFGARYIDRVSLHYRIAPSLMHRANVQPRVDQSYRLMHEKYRKEWGLIDFLGLKLLARSLPRVL